MKQETPRNLIDIYLLGRATDKEKDVLESWYLQYTDQQIDKLPEPNYLDIEQEVWSKIEEQTPGYEPRLSSLKLQAPEVQKKSISFFLMLGSVAALIFFILGVGLFYRYLPFNPFFQNTYKSTEINNIKPAKRTATLTLANGRMIKLNDSKDGVIIVAGKLTYADGSEIVLNDENDTAKVITWAENNINISTPRGGTYNPIPSQF
jgi:transmembrane sensor